MGASLHNADAALRPCLRVRIAAHRRHAVVLGSHAVVDVAVTEQFSSSYMHSKLNILAHAAVV